MPATNGSNVSSILNGLGNASAPDVSTLPANLAGSPDPGANMPSANTTYPNPPNNQAKGGPPGAAAPPSHLGIPPEAQKAFSAVRAVIGGQLPGLLVPRNAPGFKSNVTPKMLLTAGVDFYKPHDKDFVAVLFNPKKVPLQTLKKIDKAGRLDSAFPSITDFLDKGVTGDQKAGDETGANAPAGDGTAASGGPPGEDTPHLSDLNLTGSAKPTQNVPFTPILPRPTFGAGAQKSAAIARLRALAGGPPSSQPNPAGGSIVNGLFRAAS